MNPRKPLAELIMPRQPPPAEITLARARRTIAAHELATAQWRERMAAANERLAQARQDYRKWQDDTDRQHRQWVQEMDRRIAALNQEGQSRERARQRVPGPAG